MNASRILPAAILAAGLLAAPPVAALDLGGHDRDGTVIGLNFGAGWSRLTFDSSEGTDTETDFEDAFTGGFSVGWARNDNLIGSLAVYGWKQDYAQDITPISVTTFHFLAELAWFPRGEGFWLKGGLGGGTLDVSAVLPQERVTYQEGGWTYCLGAGYEFRVSDQTAVGFAYDFRWIRVGEFEFLEDTTAMTHAASVNIRWYMM